MNRLLLLFLIVFVCPSVSSREAVVGMSERVFRTISGAQDLIDAEQYVEARARLDSLMERRLSSYETAHALSLQGFIWYQQDNLGKAREIYEQALGQRQLPDSMQTSLLLTLGQVCLVQEEYGDAENYLQRLLNQPDQATPANRVLLANAFTGLKKFEMARDTLSEAVRLSDEAGRRPRENWLTMLSSAHYELKDYAGMRDVVRRLVREYPREQYLINLAALHGQLGDTSRQLSLVEALADDGRVRQEAHLLMLVNLFMAEDLPYKAAALAQRELDAGNISATENHLELLSQAWYTASEPKKALKPLEKAAAMSEDGELYLRLARLHVDAYSWSAADRAARAALAKGGLRQEGHAWLLRGMAMVRQKQFAEAVELLARAREFQETEHHAAQWITWVESETHRREAMEAHRQEVAPEAVTAEEAA